MRAWPVARSIFDAPLGERSERADNKLDNTSAFDDDIRIPSTVFVGRKVKRKHRARPRADRVLPDHRDKPSFKIAGGCARRTTLFV